MNVFHFDSIKIYDSVALVCIAGKDIVVNHSKILSRVAFVFSSISCFSDL